jgi:hypothetical protein
VQEGWRWSRSGRAGGGRSGREVGAEAQAEARSAERASRVQEGWRGGRGRSGREVESFVPDVALLKLIAHCLGDPVPLVR